MKKLLLSFLLLTAMGANTQELRVEKITAPQQVPFAAPFSAYILVSHPQGQTPILPEDSLNPDFALTRLEMQPVSSTVTQANLTLVPFTLQKSTFTAQFALAQHPDVKTPLEIVLEVTPVKLFKDNQFKEIRPPHRPFNWLLGLLIVLVLAAAAVLLARYLRRKKAGKHVGDFTDNRPPHVIALSQIDKLLDSGIWEQHQYKLFYITLTDILRTYLARMFGMDVSADTTAELLRHIKDHAQLRTFAADLRTLLASGDLVKFAKAVPDEATRNRDVSLLRTFITKTAPAPKPQAPARVEVKL